VEAKMKLRKTFKVMMSLVLLLPMLATAAAYEAGKHYEELADPVRQRDANKIEVVELFWYGCVHCFKFDPVLSQWVKKQADDVDFWHSPAMWNKRMSIHAQAFYTAQALGIFEKIHVPFFTALNVERKKLDDIDELAAFFAQYGVDQAKFKKTFNSFGVTSSVARADARARSYKISGTPEMVVAGKYRISSTMAGSQAEMLKVAEFLIAKERAAKAK
jgi:thiol:disulfide interchange protein DsbA